MKEDLTAEEEVQRKKCKLAELGTALLADPEANIKFLKEMLQIAGDKDPDIVKLGLLSLSAVFTDIIEYIPFSYFYALFLLQHCVYGEE